MSSEQTDIGKVHDEVHDDVVIVVRGLAAADVAAAVTKAGGKVTIAPFVLDGDARSVVRTLATRAG